MTTATTTFNLPNYSFSAGILQALQRAKPRSRGGLSFRGPSPFEIPESVEFVIVNPNLLRIRFGYSDNEKAERQERRASADGLITVLLAEKTKKILQLSFQQDIIELLESDFSFDRDGLMVAFGDKALTNQAANSFTRSVLVIQTILNSAPNELKDSLRAAAQTMAIEDNG